MIDTPARPFHVEVRNCFEEERRDNPETCVCGLERLRIEHAAMKQLLTAMLRDEMEVPAAFFDKYIPQMEELLSMMER